MSRRITARRVVNAVMKYTREQIALAVDRANGAAVTAAQMADADKATDAMGKMIDALVAERDRLAGPPPPVVAIFDMSDAECQAATNAMRESKLSIGADYLDLRFGGSEIVLDGTFTLDDLATITKLWKEALCAN